MKVIIHDLGPKYGELLKKKCDMVIFADGKYAPCQGCFGCWTKHPAECYMKDSLHTICRVIGKADELEAAFPCLLDHRKRGCLIVAAAA